MCKKEVAPDYSSLVTNLPCCAYEKSTTGYYPTNCPDDRVWKQVYPDSQRLFSQNGRRHLLQLHKRCCGNRCVAVQNAIKRDIPGHFCMFRTSLSQLHGYNTRNGFLPKLPKPQRECGKCTTHFKALNDFASLPNASRKP